MSYSTVVWLPNALILTALLGAFAVWRWRRKGPLVGLRWVGVAMLPLALYGIGLFRLLWTVGLAVSRFVTGFAFRPSVWFGLMLFAVAVVLIALPTKLNRRSSQEASPRRLSSGKSAPAKSAPARRQDDDMAEIEDILKRHGLG